MEHLRDSLPDLLTALSGRRWRTAARARRALVAGVAAVALTLGASGCIFSPREPDGAPDEGPEIPWETPTSTDAVLRNLAAALAGEGISNYMDCFTSEDDGGFRFYVDPQDSLAAGTEGEDRYANWDREDEATYVSSVFFDAAEGILVTFTTVEEPDENATDTYRRDDYELSITWQSGDHQPGEQVLYKGRVTLHLKKDDTELWSIYRWVDRRASSPGGSQTWGVLRGDYRE